MTSVMLWGILALMIAKAILLLAMAIPHPRRRERGLRVVVLIMLTAFSAGLLLYMVGSIGWFVLLFLGVLAAVVWVSYRTFMRRLAARVWSSAEARLRQMPSWLDWLAHFSSSASLGERANITSRSELLELIRQSPLLSETDKSRICTALEYDDMTITVLSRPLDDFKSVAINETIGPLVLDELHHAKQAVFPVINEQGVIVGTVRYDALMNASREAVEIASLMQPHVLRLSSSTSVADALQTMVRDGLWLALVHDDADEAAITLDDLSRYLLGKRGR